MRNIQFLLQEGQTFPHILFQTAEFSIFPHTTHVRLNKLIVKKFFSFLY